jgi:hypothetical protein
MRAPLEFCSKRGVVAVLASGVVISLTALTGGIAPAFADPKTEPLVPTTTIPAPEPEVIIPEETTAAEPDAEVPETPPSAPVTLPAPETVEAPPQTQVTQTQAPQTQAPQPSPQTVAATAPVITPETTADTPASRAAAPSTTEQASETSAEKSPASATPAAPSAAATTSVATGASETAPVSSVLPSPALVAPTAETTTGPAAPETEAETSSAGAETSESLTVSQAAQAIERAEPHTLEAPEQDVQIAKTAKVVEVKPDPAPKQDVDALSSELDVDLGPGGRDGVNASATAEVSLASARVWDRDIRQWSPDWVEYDEYYRPVILNPFRDAVRIVYVYQNAPRIVWIPPLARIVLEVAEFAAYSFTALVATPAILVNAAVNTALNVAVGSFFGGGFFPGFGLPLPPPPPPVLRYDNVPVLVRYSDRVYEPFRVRRIVDVGDDVRFGERKVLLDGATPAWGVWTQTPSGERQFEVHRTQQFPGLDSPREAPLPGDYQLRLAADETSSSGFTSRDIFLFVAAGVIATLGFGAIGLASWLGRRRPQH